MSQPHVNRRYVAHLINEKALHGKGVAKMPPGPGLSPAQIKAVEAWITPGAKK